MNMSKAAKNTRRRPAVVLMIDTCVWLDLAKDYSQRSLLSALEEMVRMGQVSLLTPMLVVQEFNRNKERIVEESARSIGSTLRRAKEVLSKFGDNREKAEAIRQLNEIDQQSVNYRDAAAEGVQRIEKLLSRSVQIRTSADIKLAAAERAIRNKAPFHRQRNSMNDAMLIEIFGDQQKGRGGHYVFVTHNIKDFSYMGVDEQKPHPDIAKFFSSKSHYFTKLGDALNKFRPVEFSDIMIEQTWFEPPRRYVEISEAIEKLRERWYNRHKIWSEKLESGEAILIDNHEDRGKDPFGLRIHRGVWEGAEKSARRVEQ